VVDEGWRKVRGDGYSGSLRTYASHRYTRQAANRYVSDQTRLPRAMIQLEASCRHRLVDTCAYERERSGAAMADSIAQPRNAMFLPRVRCAEVTTFMALLVASTAFEAA
jgi:hypothetical protein